MELDPIRRERILAAAAKLIVANGLQCSMAAVAEEAGVATGSIYNYFKSKDDMIRGVYAQLADVICGRLIPEADSLDDAKARIFRYIFDYIDFIWEDRERAMLFEYLSSVPLISMQELSQTFATINRYSLGLMAGGQHAGLLADMPPATLAGYIGGGIRNTLKWRRADPDPLTANEREELALMSWKAIAK
ncbi:TetR/AcrR family transcriptional regulator [Rhizobium rhizogenes]|uniref:TetR/AcrR family transcriptional regulator n=1 Tax=Rhizobium rhizogenes TaxID=359 RepID=UPI002270C94E|nr:TetR/AcrR family transcriptional regulator [Rhizobium rhizogenes]